MKSINHNAPVTCSKSIAINANVGKVWSVLTNINAWSSWQSDISKAKINGNLAAGSSFDWKTGGVAIHSTLHTVLPNRVLGWTGKTLGAFAVHNWTLSEQNGQTVVVVDESMEGFLVSLLRKSFRQNLENGMQRWLDLLKKTCEA